MMPPARVARLCVAVFLFALTTAQSHAFCFVEAAARYDLRPEWLMAIAEVESSYNPNAVSTNTDGTKNYGVMQINETNLEGLALLGITRENIMEPCRNVLAGAWVLAYFIKRYGRTWRAIGSYNTGHRPELEASRITYVQKVQTALMNIERKRRMQVAQAKTQPQLQ